MLEKLIEKEVANYRPIRDFDPVDDSHVMVKFNHTMTPLNDLSNYRNLVQVRFNSIKSIYDQVMSTNPLLASQINITMPFCFSDKSDTPIAKQPALVFSKEAYSNNIMIPSLDQLSGRIELNMAAVDKFEIEYKDKSDLACFAGSLTNIYWNNRGMEHNNRLRLCNLAAKYPEMFDCTLSMPPGFDPLEWEEVEGKVKKAFPRLWNSGFFAPNRKLTIADQLEYRYLISADGHTSAWARLPWQVYSNSVCIKIRNRHHDFIEWFYPLLNKSKHLIEIDLEDLVDTIKILKSDTEYAETIAAGGRDFCLEFLTQETAINIFFSTLLQLTGIDNE